MATRDHRGRTGSHSARPSRKRSTSIEEQFVPMVRSLLESDALASLSLAARRCLDRIMIEHLLHAGKENGALKVPYADFVRFGIRHASIAGAIRELEDVGFVRVEERGRGGNREYRRPSVYRISFLDTPHAKRTDDWRQYVPDPPRDIDSRRENEPGAVGAKTCPKTEPARRENEPETVHKTSPKN